MSNIRTRRAIATLFVLGLLASACGQKDGVHVDLASRAPGNAAVPGAVNPTTGAVDPTATAAPFVDTDGDGLDDATNATQQELALGDPSLASPTDPGAGGDPAAGGGGAGAGGGTDPGATDPGAGGAPAPGSAPGAPAGGNTNAGTPSGPSGGGGPRRPRAQ